MVDQFLPPTPPGPAPEEPPSSSAGHKGFLSEEDRRKFNIRAGLLVALAFVAQFVVPFVAMVPFMYWTVTSQQDLLWMGKPGCGALHDGAVWFPELFMEARKAGDGRNAVLKKLPLDGDEDPQKVQDLEMTDPWLLAGGDRLWIITPTDVAFLRDDWVTPFETGLSLGPITPPFLHRGLPAVIEETRSGTRLIVFEDGNWREEFPIELGETSLHGLQVLSMGSTLHLFQCDQMSLFTFTVNPDLPPDPRGWEEVGPAGARWQAILLDGEPVVFRLTSGGFKRMIHGLKRGPEGWEIFFENPVPMATELGVYPLPGGERFAVLIQSMPGSFRLWTVEGDRVVEQKRFGRGFPFPRGVFLAMMLPQGIFILLPIALVFVLSGLMRRHRVPDYVTESRSVPFASLTQRGLASLVDGFFLGLPSMTGSVMWMVVMMDMEEYFFLRPALPIAAMALVVIGMLWMLAGLAVFSILEGKYGATPGKWAFGIRVLGTELAPCGFGRALIRKLLLFVDGFFGFLVGILLVAFTENQQRLGDMAARTVVVEKPKDR